MSDQLITVLGTLGGAFLGIVGAIIGVILSNRFESKKAKLERDVKAVEEVYTAINKINIFYSSISTDLTLQFYDPQKEQPVNFVQKSEEIRPTLERVSTIVHLYLPTIVDNLNRFEKATTSLWHSQESFNNRMKHNNDPASALVALNKSVEHFKKEFQTILSALEKLVR